jgi:hypothetical protein
MQIIQPLEELAPHSQHRINYGHEHRVAVRELTHPRLEAALHRRANLQSESLQDAAQVVLEFDPAT